MKEHRFSESASKQEQVASELTNALGCDEVQPGNRGTLLLYEESDEDGHEELLTKSAESAYSETEVLRNIMTGTRLVTKTCCMQRAVDERRRRFLQSKVGC